MSELIKVSQGPIVTAVIFTSGFYWQVQGLGFRDLGLVATVSMLCHKQQVTMFCWSFAAGETRHRGSKTRSFPNLHLGV